MNAEQFKTIGALCVAGAAAVAASWGVLYAIAKAVEVFARSFVG